MTKLLDLLLMTHLASADDTLMDNGQTAEQAAQFAKLVEQLKPARASFNNSAGTLLPNLPRYDLVRPGIAMMGCPPRETGGEFLPVITLTAPIIQLRDIAAWETVGYNGTWTATRPSCRR